MGLVRYLLGDFSAAAVALRSAIKLKAAIGMQLVLLAMCLSESGEYGQAIPGLRRAFMSLESALDGNGGKVIPFYFTFVPVLLLVVLFRVLILILLIVVFVFRISR